MHPRAIRYLSCLPAFFAAAVLTVVPHLTAHAAQPARLDGKAIELKAGPGKKSKTIATLQGNQYVLASNLPLEGYYKIRTKEQEVGWVATESIIILRPAKARDSAPDSGSDSASDSVSEATPDSTSDQPADIE